MARVPDDLNGAVGALRRALEGGPSPRVYAPLAEAYRLTGRPGEAVSTAREGLRAFPGHLAIRLVLARSLADLGEEEEAQEAYRQILREDPGNVEAAAYSVQGQASPELEGVGIRESPGTLSEELEHLAELFGDPYERRDGERHPDGIATLTLAEIYARQGLAEKAIEICEAMLEKNPDNEQVSAKLIEYRRSLASVE